MIAEKLLEAGVYPLFLKQSIKHYTGSEHIKNKVKRYFKYIDTYTEEDAPKGHGIFFEGHPVASGADLLINLVAKKALLSGQTARVISCSDLTTEFVHANYSLDTVSTDFLCITGLGLAAPNPVEKRAITTVMWERYYNELPTCLLSSVPLMEGEHSILAYYGEEVAEVIDQRCLVLECKTSRREREANHADIRERIFGE